MTNYDDYRFQSHHILLELDAATTALMMLVSGRQTEGPRRCGAVERHKLAYETWAAFLRPPATDPMPVLDGRATGQYGPFTE
jgi:hypothetical protein